LILSTHRAHSNRRPFSAPIDSALARWFSERPGNAGGRMRKVLIVALARKLLIALWRFAVHGVLPEGAAVKPV